MQNVYFYIFYFLFFFYFFVFILFLSWTQPARPSPWPKPATRLGCRHAWFKPRVRCITFAPFSSLLNQMCRTEDKRKALPGDSKAQATATVRALPENSPFLLLSVSSPLFLCFCLLGFLLTLCSPLLFVCYDWILRLNQRWV